MDHRTKKQVGTFRTSDGVDLYYEVRGDGLPVVFVYGIACLMNHWIHQINFFSRKFKVITYDLRGHHKSGNPKEVSSLTIKRLGQDLVELMKFLEIKKAHFVGHSFGTPVIIEAHHQDPEIFQSMTYINGFSSNPIKNMFGMDIVAPLFFGIKTQYESNPILWNKVWQWTTHNAFTQWVAGLVGGFNLKLTQFKDIEIYTKGLAQIDLSVFIPLFEEMMNYEGDQKLKNVKIPTLIISGENDFVTPLHHQEKMSLLIPKSEWVTIPYGSHCCQLDFPEYVNLKLEKYFESF